MTHLEYFQPLVIWYIYGGLLAELGFQSDFVITWRECCSHHVEHLEMQ